MDKPEWMSFFFFSFSDGVSFLRLGIEINFFFLSSSFPTLRVYNIGRPVQVCIYL